MTRSLATSLYELELEFVETDMQRADAEYPNGSWDHYEAMAERELMQAIGYASI